MKIFFRTSIGIFLLSMLISCSKKDNLGISNPNYIGNWSSESVGGKYLKKLRIEKYGDSKFQDCTYDSNYGPCAGQSYCYKCNDKEGEATIENDHMFIGSKNFKINTPPYYSSQGRMQMVLNGDTYEKESDGTCWDKIKNQNETNVDCGGVCNSCASCFDNTKNQGETFVDCGGANCDSCFSKFRYEFNDPMQFYQRGYTPKDLDASVDNNSFAIKADEHSTYQSIKLYFTISDTGTVNLDPSTRFAPGGSGLDYFFKSGTIHITSWDKTTRKINGKFSYIYTNSSYKSGSPSENIFIEGEFKDLKYYLR